MEKQQQSKNITILLLSAGLVIAIITIFILSKKLTTATPVTEGYVGKGLESIKFNYTIFRFGPRLGSIREDLAVSNVGAYRQIHPPTEGYGVYYDSSDMAYYCTEIFPKLVAAQIKFMKDHGKPYDESKYKWKIGFYWVLNKDKDGKIKYDYCMVPILINENDPNDRIEYFLSGDSQYDHNPTIMLRRRGAPEKEDSASNGNVFNTGTMFP